MNSQLRLRPLIVPSFADTASAEMFLFENEVLYPAAHVLTDTYEPSPFPDLQQLLKSDSFKQNITLALNISTENLTGLLHNQLLHDPNQTLDHISSHQPPSVPVLVTLTVFYTIIFVAGVLGNLITCIVISRNKFMHTATNFYLFNLAVSDLILLLSGAPQDLYNFWYPNAFPFTDALCILHSILAETATNATVLTITAFTVERYIAICHPFRQHTMSKLSRAIKFIFAIWIAALLLALPQAMQFSVVQDQGGTSCTIDNNFVAHVFAVSGFIFFGGPMTAICVLYVLIGIKLKRSRLLQAAPRRSYDIHRGISAQGRVIRMLVAVAVAFFICWAPFHAQRLMAVYGSTASIKSKLFKDVFEAVDYISSVLYYLSTCINPLLYNIMSHKFRDAFKVTLARHIGLSGRYQSQSHNYSALMRQNGSMRLHTTDSIRTTTTTTTTINSSNTGFGTGGTVGGGSGVSCRSAHRHPGACVGSTLTSLNKQGACGSTAADCRENTQPPRHQHVILQSQISQASSVGDANSLMGTDADEHSFSYFHSHSSKPCCLKDLMHSVATDSPGYEAKACNTKLARDNLVNEARASRASTKCDCSDDDTELFTGSKAKYIPRITVLSTKSARPLNATSSIAELSIHPPTRSRLKLSRIISRRNQDMPISQCQPRVKVVRTHVPHEGHLKFLINERETSLGGEAHVAKGNEFFNNRTPKFRWGARKKEPAKRSKNMQASSSSLNDSTPAMHYSATTKIVHPATSVTTSETEALQAAESKMPT